MVFCREEAVMKEKAGTFLTSLLRDAVFGAFLFVVIVVLTLISTKAANFIYAMF
jgi:hypothetical protein